MTCQEFADALDLYLDDELSVMEILHVQGHLHSCDHCRTMMGTEAALHALLAADAIQDQAPRALRDRIVQRVSAAAASSSASVRRRRAVPVAALRAPIALVGLLVIALLVPGIRGPVELPRFAVEAAAQHHLSREGAEAGLDLTTTDLPRLSGWLRGRVGFPVKAPDVNRPDQHLVGGRVASVGGAPAAHLLYEWGGYRLSLFVMPSPPTRPEWTERVIDGVELYTAKLQGTTVTWWEDAARLYVAVSATSPRALEEFALLCFRTGGLGGPRLPPAEPRDG
jgi:mycothiol system anti-sigma-R factor